MPGGGQAGGTAGVEAPRGGPPAEALEVAALRDAVLARDGDLLVDCAEAMAQSFAAGGRLFTFGNGGSSTDAQDVATVFLRPPGAARPLPASALTSDIAVVTALANDVGFDAVVARQLAAFGRPGDIALGTSASGDCANLLRGFDEAGRKGMLTIGVAGHDGGRMAEVDTIDYLFVIPSTSVHRIQEAQATVHHVLWELTQRTLEAAGAASPT
jgi:D-sedoheptulose 7-phosphate isomerase